MAETPHMAVIRFQLWHIPQPYCRSLSGERYERDEGHSEALW